MAEACYVPQYLPASFKFVPFLATDATSEHGRRGAEGEFPFGEQTAYADLGRKIRVYSITARFDSNNHIIEAAALIAACELAGPGVLTHPTRGVILSAACRSVRVTDRIEDEGGVTYVDLEFVEANNWPNGLSLFGQLLGIVLTGIIGASSDSFRARYTPHRIQPFRKASVVDAAQDQIAGIRDAYAQATTVQADDKLRQRILLDLDNLSSDDTLAEQADVMDRGIALGMNAVALKLSGRDKFATFRALANRAARTSVFSEPAAGVENAVYSHARVCAACYMAEGALEEQNVRTGEVFGQIDVIDAILSQEAEYARGICDNHLYAAITKFRDDAMANLYQKAYDSPGLVEYNFNGSVHPLVAAYSIYGDAKKHRELEMLNVISNSGMMGPSVAGVRGVN